MKNINPWLLSVFVLTFSGITFRWWLEKSILSILLALILALSVVPLVKLIQVKNKPRKDFQAYKLIGGFISMFGLAISAYFNLFSLTSPNPRVALVGSITFAIGLGIILVNRYKNQFGRDDHT